MIRCQVDLLPKRYHGPVCYLSSSMKIGSELRLHVKPELHHVPTRRAIRCSVPCKVTAAQASPQVDR